jgi:hypothetical protein
MGILEAVVVVYLRQIYYPSGFDFPLVPIPGKMLTIEWFREITTIIMLVSAGVLAGRNPIGKFAYFLFTFAIWDIFYYIGLKIFLDWPPSLLTWDILFLIPVTWIGPVLAPVICSIIMIFMSMCIIIPQEKGYEVRINLIEWFLIIVGAFLIFLTFIWDYTKIIIQNGFLCEFGTLACNEKFWQIIKQHVPVYYNWYLFGLGEILILSAIALFLKKLSVVRPFKVAL